MNKFEVYRKSIRVINSCTEPKHLETTLNYARLTCVALFSDQLEGKVRAAMDRRETLIRYWEFVNNIRRQIGGELLEPLEVGLSE